MSPGKITERQMKSCCAVLPPVAGKSSELREPRLVSVTQALTDAVKLGRCLGYATREKIRRILWWCGKKMFDITFSECSTELAMHSTRCHSLHEFVFW